MPAPASAQRAGFSLLFKMVFIINGIYPFNNEVLKILNKIGGT